MQVPARKMHVFQALQYLRKVCSHPLLALAPGQPNYDTVIERGSAPAHIWSPAADADDDAGPAAPPKTAEDRLRRLHALGYAPKLRALRYVRFVSAWWAGGLRRSRAGWPTRRRAISARHLPPTRRRAISTRDQPAAVQYQPD